MKTLYNKIKGWFKPDPLRVRYSPFITPYIEYPGNETMIVYNDGTKLFLKGNHVDKIKPYLIMKDIPYYEPSINRVISITNIKDIYYIPKRETDETKQP